MFHICLCAETKIEVMNDFYSLNEEQRLMQAQQTDNFIGFSPSMDPANKRKFLIMSNIIEPTAEECDNICKWFGVVCQGHAVFAIHWRYGGAGLRPIALDGVDLNWLPRTLDTIAVIGLKMGKELNTGCLPRRLRCIQAPECDIRGSLDLTVLPETLEYLSLQFNRIQGAACLTALPERMKCIELMGNEIAKVFVSNASFPEGLQSIILDAPSRWSLRVVPVDGQKVDRRVHFSHNARRHM